MKISPGFKFSDSINRVRMNIKSLAKLFLLAVFKSFYRTYKSNIFGFQSGVTLRHSSLYRAIKHIFRFRSHEQMRWLNAKTNIAGVAYLIITRYLLSVKNKTNPMSTPILSFVFAQSDSKLPITRLQDRSSPQPAALCLFHVFKKSTFRIFECAAFKLRAIFEKYLHGQIIAQGDYY